MNNSQSGLILGFHQTSGSVLVQTKSVAIFGATSALGQAVARELLLVYAQQGETSVHLFLVARNESRMNEVANDLKTRGAQTTCIVCDMDAIDDHAELVDSLEDIEDFWFFYGSLPDQKQVQETWEATESAMLTNLLSPMSLLTNIANKLEQTGLGSLVVVSSVAGDRGRQSNYIYGTAKGGLSLFCQGLRNRLAARSIPVMTVKPGFINTPMTQGIEKKPAVLWVTPDRVAREMVRAHSRGRDVLYSVFKKLSL